VFVTRSVVLATLAALTLGAGIARADEASVCGEAYEDAQLLMRPGPDTSLLRARERARTCTRPACKEWVVTDCSKWLLEIEARIPTVVFTATTSDGTDVSDVAVASSIGRVLTSRLDGRAIEVEPGEDDFTFTSTDGRTKKVHAVVREGVRAQLVSVVFEPPEASPAPVPAPAAAPPRAITAPAPEKPNADERATFAQVGYGVGAAGLVGVVIGAIFGLRALGEKADAECVAGRCEREPLDAARASATASTIAFAVGGVLVGAGAALVLGAPWLGARSGRSRASAARPFLLGTTW
jgi:hypothetical protein